MSARNVERYIEGTMDHVPSNYAMCVEEVWQLIERRRSCDIAADAWCFGFEIAYRAAKRGKLDFQNIKGSGTRQKINELLAKITDEEQLQRIYEFMKYVYIQPDPRQQEKKEMNHDSSDTAKRFPCNVFMMTEEQRAQLIETK